MKRKNRIFLLRGLAFLLLLAAILVPVTQIFARKSLEKPWDMRNKIGGFYNEPEDEFQVMFFGSSHACASFSPLALWDSTGVKSYVFATQLQPLWATYAYLQEALKTQSPSLVVVECYMTADREDYKADGVNYSFMDELPLSFNKIRLAQASAPTWQEQLALLWNFPKYHTRWSELTAQDLALDRGKLADPYRGFVLLPKRDGFVPTRTDTSDVTEAEELTEKNALYLQKIMSLCAEKGIALWLCKSPSNTTAQERAVLLRVQQMAQENGVPFDDFNLCYEEIGIDAATDFYDERHMNGSGADKFTRWFAALMQQRYPELAADPEDAAWREAYAGYAETIEAQRSGDGT